jgi:hypothetical protein
MFALVIPVGFTAQAMGLEGVELGARYDSQKRGIRPNRGAEGGEELLAEDLTTLIVVPASDNLTAQLAG